MKHLSQLIGNIFLGIIWLYKKVISPFTPSTCRFQPSCSSYGQQAIKRFGPWKGSVLALKRISKCHPWGDYGYDPVPEKKEL